MRERRTHVSLATDDVGLDAAEGCAQVGRRVVVSLIVRPPLEGTPVRALVLPVRRVPVVCNTSFC